jgi:hypothetical protein
MPMLFTHIITDFCRNVKPQVLDLAISAILEAVLAESTSVRHSAAYTTHLVSAVFCRTWSSICRAAYRPVGPSGHINAAQSIGSLKSSCPMNLPWIISSSLLARSAPTGEVWFPPCSFSGLVGFSSISMLQSIANLHMLSGFHKAMIESQHPSRVFHYTSLQERILVPFGSYIGRNDAFAG